MPSRPTYGSMSLPTTHESRWNKMTIAQNYEVGKGETINLSAIISNIFDQVMAIGRAALVSALETWDTELLQTRDRERYRCKGLQTASIKTKLGVVTYRRRVYIDRAVSSGVHCVHLLDQALQIDKVGLIASDVCELSAELICRMSYRDVAKTIGESTGLTLSHKGVWNLIQRFSELPQALVQRWNQLNERQAGTGTVSSDILYEEKDGVWLKLQGKDRLAHGPDKEMKVGIVYDGALWQESAHKTKRRSLDNKVAYATFDPLPEFQKGLNAVASGKFQLDQVKLWVTNGDGANWIQGKNTPEHLYTLDAYHRNRKISRCVQDPALVQELLRLLYAKDIPALLQRIEEALAQTEDEKAREGLQTLLSYYRENQDALLSYYDRNVKIPETREPGVVHHARLGSMESNIYTIIGNRMKDSRACWSIRGGNHLALLLCLYHTDGFGHLFDPLPSLPETVEEDSKAEVDFPEDPFGPPISAAKMPLSVGKGNACYCRATVPNSSWLKQITGYKSFADLSLQ